MAAVHASLLAKDINNNILAALPVEKLGAQTFHDERRVVQPGLIRDPEEEVQHLIRFVALDGRTESGCPLWCFPGVIPVVGVSLDIENYCTASLFFEQTCL